VSIVTRFWAERWVPSADPVAAVPVVPYVPVVVASGVVVEFMRPGVVPSRTVVMVVWPCNWSKF